MLDLYVVREYDANANFEITGDKITRWGNTSKPIPTAPDLEAAAASLKIKRDNIKRSKMSLSAGEFRIALLKTCGITDAKVYAAITKYGGDDAPSLKILFDYEPYFNRMHPGVVAFGQVLGIAEEQMDALFGEIL